MLKKLFNFGKKESPPTAARDFDTCQQEMGACAPRDRGIRPVALDRITGSIGRYNDFDNHFRLKPHMPSDRLRQIKQAMRQGTALGPVQLYQIKDAYYVLDGNHRIAAAKELGHDEILARVVELAPSENTYQNLLYCERADFFDRTGLSAEIDLSEIGQYDRLLHQITRHQAYLQEADPNSSVTFEAAARDWYKTIYQPLCTIIRRARLIDSFPERTVADLYVYITYYQWYKFRERSYGIGIDKIIPKDMEAFRNKMADLKNLEYPEMKRDITAFILMSVQAKREYKLIEKLYELDEVKEVHSVHGDVDLLVKIELTRDLLNSDAEIISHFVHENIRQLNGVKSTKTLIPGLSRIKSPGKKAH